jgi:hypothetical protein
MKKLTPILLALLFVVLHGWALWELWTHGPANRQVILVCVYSGFLAGSALITRRLPPPLLPSMILFAVVLGWRLMFLLNT